MCSRSICSKEYCCILDIQIDVLQTIPSEPLIFCSNLNLKFYLILWMSLCDLIYFCVEIHKQMKIQSYPFHMVIYNSRKHADGLLPILHSNSFCYEYIYLVNVHIFNVFIFLSPVSSLPRASTCRQCHLVPLLSKAHSFSHICQELNFWKCFCRNYWG